LIRTYLEQYEIPEDRIEGFRIVERLVGAVDRLSIDPEPIFGVILDLDGQIAMDALHEDMILDRDVRVPARSMMIARGSLPLEFVLRGLANFGLTSIIDIMKSLAVHGPLKGLEASGGLSDLKHHIKIRSVAHESGKCGVSIVSVELLKVPLERTAKDTVERILLGMLSIESIDGKDILRCDIGLQSKLHVVAEQHVLFR
jgi:hypothetical protein